jgi:hypothetical protein
MMTSKSIETQKSKEIYLNVWPANSRIPENVIAYIFTLVGAPLTENERWKLINKLVGKLASKGFDATHVPEGAKKSLHGDIAVLSTKPLNVEYIVSLIRQVANVKAEFSRKIQLSYPEHSYLFEKAWQNTFRECMKKRGFLCSAGNYVPMSEFEKKDPKKPSYRISATIIKGIPSIWIDPGQRIMIPLNFQEAVKATEDNSIPVRVLMDWKKAFVVGVCEETVGSYDGYPLLNHWKERGIPVKENHRLVKVKFGGETKAYLYPEICVYKEFEYGIKEYSGRKYRPVERIELAQRLIAKIGEIPFLDCRFSFQLEPLTLSTLDFRLSQFSSPKDFMVLLQKNGRRYQTNLLKVKEELENGAEPYTKKVDGKYAVVAPSVAREYIDKAFRLIEETYAKLNLGTIKQILPVRYVDGEKISVFKEAFNLTISELTEKAQGEKVIVFIILPTTRYAGRIYYEAKHTFFNPSFFEEVKPFQTQCIEFENLRAIAAGKIDICETLAPQIYLKLHGKNAAVWLCLQPADAHVYNEAGITAYACFDVSRRREYKSEISVFTTVTDPYGRFISFDVIHSGGEGLTKLSFHKLIERIAQVCKSYSTLFAKLEPTLKFDLKRIVLYRDGYITQAWKNLMKDTFYNGVPEEGIEPIPEFFKNRKDLPSTLSIDIVGVNKTPNRRAYLRLKDDWYNVKRGTCIIEGEDRCLLISSSPHRDKEGNETTTLQPIEIEKVHHLTINSTLAEPTVDALAREYFHLTYLNWLSFRQRSKFALPQKITQRVGEYISAQVEIPPSVIVW